MNILKNLHKHWQNDNNRLEKLLTKIIFPFFKNIFVRSIPFQFVSLFTVNRFVYTDRRLDYDAV